MSDDQPQALSDGITFQATVPAEWCKIQSLPIGSIQSQTSSANLRLLNALNVLEDIPQDFEKTSQSLSESVHLDAKLDLILGMLGELLHQQAKIPEMSQVIVSSHTLSFIELKAVTLPMPDDLLRVKLFLDTRFPQALTLYGQVASATTEGFSLTLCDVGDLAQEQLDKLIFRQHRRAIASSRNESNT